MDTTESLILIIIFGIGIIVGINAALYDFVNIKLPFSKEYFYKNYKGRLSPIYKLELREEVFTDSYTVYKYELDWRKPKFKWYNYILLGSTAFQTYGYTQRESYGTFTHYEVETTELKKLLKHKNLKNYWEAEATYEKNRKKKYQDRKEKFSDKLLEINKEFYENHK